MHAVLETSLRLHPGVIVVLVPCRIGAPRSCRREIDDARCALSEHRRRHRSHPIIRKSVRANLQEDEDDA